MQKAPLIEERKDQKDLQDIAQKLIETISSVASASLEQTTWLRRTLAVKSGVQQDITDHEEADLVDAVKVKLPPNENTANLSAYSVQALFVLAEVSFPLLHFIYSIFTPMFFFMFRCSVTVYCYFAAVIVTCTEF